MSFLGEHEIKIDSKGRMRLPAGIKKQLNPAANGRFVINRGFESTLQIYPFDVWEKTRAKVESLNTFNKQNRKFVRSFLAGATELVLDSADRINIPKHLLKYADITSEAILTPGKHTLELWNKKRYEAEMDFDSDDFADLAESVLGDIDLGNDEGK